MLTLVVAVVDVGPLRWVPHPEVWLLVAGVIGLGVCVARVIAPKVPGAVPGTTATVSPRCRAWFWLGVVTLWVSADWPMHDVAEGYLYLVHMVQHALLTLVMPPLFWLSVPSWLAELVVPKGTPAREMLRKLARPIWAGVIFNALVLLSHWPVLVNLSVYNGAFHYSVHLCLVAAALLMWVPVCGPWADSRLNAPAQCIYLFAQSIIPTVPSAWLAMADEPIFAAYDHFPRMFELSVLDDQMIAGFIMKLGAGTYLWLLIIAIFFRWALAHERQAQKAYLVRIDDDGRVQRVHPPEDTVPSDRPPRGA
jgi:putative membrane protein